MPLRVKEGLQLPRLDHQDDALGEAVGAFGVVLFLQAGTEGPGEGLPEAGSDRTHKGLDGLVAGGVALAIDELDEQFAL